MSYLKVHWIHKNLNDPVVLMSELDADRYEVRKVEVFADGRLGFASTDQASEETVLSEKAVPDASEIAADPQFVVQEIDAEEFERTWVAAVSGARLHP